MLTLARGHYCPKEHHQHLELAAVYPKFAAAYTQIATKLGPLARIMAEPFAKLGAWRNVLKPKIDPPSLWKDTVATTGRRVYASHPRGQGLHTFA